MDHIKNDSKIYYVYLFVNNTNSSDYLKILIMEQGNFLIILLKWVLKLKREVMK